MALFVMLLCSFVVFSGFLAGYFFVYVDDAVFDYRAEGFQEG